MNIKQELHKELLAFMRKVTDQSYTVREWEYFALNSYQDELLESVRAEMVDVIKRSLKSEKRQSFTPEMKLIIQRLIDDLEDMKI